jgi:tRNA isopentenyl-2-thiomethyl-A-37 hydroxylase MiaE
LPYAFTEHGALMAAGILNTPRAVEVSVFVVRAFVKLRHSIAEYKELVQKLSQLVRKLIRHDEQLMALMQAIRQLMNPEPIPIRRRIGFGNQDP